MYDDVLGPVLVFYGGWVIAAAAVLVVAGRRFPGQRAVLAALILAHATSGVLGLRGFPALTVACMALIAAAVIKDRRASPATG